MRSKKDIEKKIEELQEDERLGYPNATVFSNAPLALIQLSLKAKLDALNWALEQKEELLSG